MEQLGINLPGLITQLVSFLLLAVGLYVLLHKPLTNALDQRSNRIKESLEAADRASREAEESAERVEQEMVGARREGQKLISDAREASDRLRDQEIAKTRSQVEHMLEAARSEIRQEREAAMNELRREFSSLAVFAAEKVINESLNVRSHSKLLNSILEEAFPKGESKN